MVDHARVSRYVVPGDVRTDTVVLPLPEPWWSRPYEYAWAGSFARPGEVVLDAGCGISHPFKLWLAAPERGLEEVHAYDLDPRIISEEAIRDDIVADFGAQAALSVPSSAFARLHLRQGDMTALPYADGTFDRIFCVSVWEHLPAEARTACFAEFARTLRPGGEIVITLDVPTVEPETLPAQLAAVGLEPAAAFVTDRPDDAISSDMYGERLYCFRTVLRHLT